MFVRLSPTRGRTETVGDSASSVLPINTITVHDLRAIVEMGRQFHAQSRDADIPYDPEGAATFIAALSDSPAGFVAVGEGRFISGMLTTHPHLSKSALFAIETYWWAPGGGADLFAAFEDWARSNGAHFLCASHQASERNSAFERLYRQRGYQRHEIYFRKDLAECA